MVGAFGHCLLVSISLFLFLLSLDVNNRPLFAKFSAMAVETLGLIAFSQAKQGSLGQ